MRAAGVNLLEVHGAKKTIITNMPIEKQKPKIQEKYEEEVEQECNVMSTTCC